MSLYLLPNTAVTFTAAASSKIATYSRSGYQITKTVGYPNIPGSTSNVFVGTGSNTTAAFSAATTVTIAAGNAGLFYSTGTAPVVYERANNQATPGTLNATGTLTSALLLTQIITSSTAAAVVATLDTGTAMDAASQMNIGDSYDWDIINTGASNAFTVTASSGHTIVGVGAVLALISSRWRTTKTAAATYVSYRMS